MWKVASFSIVDMLWFGCYGVTIWFLNGKNESKWFLLFSLSDMLCVICVHKWIYRPQALTSLKSLTRLVITRYIFHACCFVIYQCTIKQDTYGSSEDEDFIKLPSEVFRFCHFSWKVRRQSNFLTYVKIRKMFEALRGVSTHLLFLNMNFLFCSPF